MNPIALGDLAQVYQLRTQNLALKARLGTLTQELATGRAADPGKRLSGDFMPLSSIEQSLATLSAYRISTAEAAMSAEAMQVSLTQLGDAATAVTPGLLLAGGSPEAALLETAGIDARGRLEQAMAALNASVAGRSLFSGAATDRPALAPAEQMMAALSAAVAGETTAEGVIAAVAAWFDIPGGGFETVTYTGTDVAAGPVRLAEGQSLSLDVTAADPALRDMLRGLATAALLEDGALLGGDVAERAELARRAGEQLTSAEAPLATLRAEIGNAQNRIETIQAENAARTAMLDLARADLVAADPYETATELEAVQIQIEALYAITARLSRLNLADFLS